MLRSVGIRARMVIGFQGGQWNHLGDYYQIRQKDAHSWTEAYIPESELDGFPGGGWLRLDPTPGNLRIDRQINSGVALRFYGEIRNYAEFLWAKYVVQLDAQRQREDIYDRLAGWANVLIDSVLQAVLVNDVKPEHEIPVGEADVEEEAGMFQKKLDGWRLTLWTAAVLLLCGCILLLRKLYRGGLRCGHSFPVKQHVPPAATLLSSVGKAACLPPLGATPRANGQATCRTDRRATDRLRADRPAGGPGPRCRCTLCVSLWRRPTQCSNGSGIGPRHHGTRQGPSHTAPGCIKNILKSTHSEAKNRKKLL